MKIIKLVSLLFYSTKTLFLELSKLVTVLLKMEIFILQFLMGWSIQLPWMYLNIWRGYKKKVEEKAGPSLVATHKWPKVFYPRESNADENKFLFLNNSPVPLSEWDGVVREYKKRRANFLRAHISPKLLRLHRQCAHIYKYLLSFFFILAFNTKKNFAEQIIIHQSFWKSLVYEPKFFHAYPQPEVNSNCIGKKKTGHVGIGRW